MASTETQTDSRLNSLLSRIGNTPLIRLERFVRNPSVKLFAKAEWYNPGGSVKDRPAIQMILDGERSGKLGEGKTIIDATSGNTGIALAMMGAVLGYEVELVVPANVGMERKRIIEAYGAKMIFSDPLEGTDGAREIVQTIVAKDPYRYFYPDQYSNPSNWEAHYQTTGREILQQTRGGVTHIIAGLGTTGTFVGTSRKLKEAVPAIQCVAVQPDGPLHGLEGLKHLPTANVPGIFDPSLVDRTIEVATEDAQEMVKRLAREEGLFVGVSSGAAAVSGLRIAEELDTGVVVMVFADNGSKYVSEKFWSS